MENRKKTTFSSLNVAENFTIGNMRARRMRFCVICLILSSFFHITFSRSAHKQEARDFAEDPERQAENEAPEVGSELVSI